MLRMLPGELSLCQVHGQSPHSHSALTQTHAPCLGAARGQTPTPTPTPPRDPSLKLMLEVRLLFSLRKIFDPGETEGSLRRWAKAEPQPALPPEEWG